MPFAPAQPKTATRPRVLVLTHRVPYPPDKGDRIRTYNTILQLAKQAEIWLITLSDESVSHTTRIMLDEVCEQVAIVPISRVQKLMRAGQSALRGRSLSEGVFYAPTIETIISRWRTQTTFDSALVSSSALAPYLHHASLNDVPKIVDMIDVDSQKWQDFALAAQFPNRWLYQYEARRVRQLERDISGWSQAIAVVSQSEADVLDQFTRPGTATVAGNGVDLDYFSVDNADEQQAIAFVGAMDYLPNIDAVTGLVQDIWPAVRQHHPEAEFRIIGRNPTLAVRRLSGIPGVVVTGAVPDVRPFVANSAVVVAPIRIARGVQNKVLEALAMGKATVASPQTLAALSVVPGRDLIRAETPEQWVSAICHLLETPQRRKELGASGRQYVEQHHCWDHCLEPLLSAVLSQHMVVQS